MYGVFIIRKFIGMRALSDRKRMIEGVEFTKPIPIVDSLVRFGTNHFDEEILAQLISGTVDPKKETAGNRFVLKPNHYLLKEQDNLKSEEAKGEKRRALLTEENLIRERFAFDPEDKALTEALFNYAKINGGFSFKTVRDESILSSLWQIAQTRYRKKSSQRDYFARLFYSGLLVGVKGQVGRYDFVPSAYRVFPVLIDEATLERDRFEEARKRSAAEGF